MSIFNQAGSAAGNMMAGFGSRIKQQYAGQPQAGGFASQQRDPNSTFEWTPEMMRNATPMPMGTIGGGSIGQGANQIRDAFGRQREGAQQWANADNRTYTGGSQGFNEALPNGGQPQMAADGINRMGGGYQTMIGRPSTGVQNIVGGGAPSNGGYQSSGGMDNGMLGQTLQNRGYDPQQLRQAQFGQALQNRGHLQTRPGQPINSGGISTTNPGMTPLTGLLGSEQAMSQALQGAMGVYGYGGQGGFGMGGGGGGGGNVNLGSEQINRPGQYQGIQDSLGNFVSSGNQALGLQGALSGAQGQEAFDSAYLDSPVQAFLREQGDRALTRNAAATGGAQGGNVQKELVRYGQGMAGQQLQQQIDNLSNMSNQGLSAGIAQGSLLGNVEGIEASRYGTNVNSMTSRANSGDSRAVGMAGIQSNNQSNLANMIMSTGTNMAQGRMNVGAGMSQNINNATNSIAGLTDAQGVGLSNIAGQGGNNISQMLAGLGMNNGNSQENLAQSLGNWQQGSSAQVGGLPGVGQFQGNALNDYGNFLSGAGNAAQAYGQYQQSQPSNYVYNGPTGNFGSYDNPGSEGYVDF